MALAEEGWTDGEVVDLVAHRYLDPILSGAGRPDVLLLGCTHFPVLAPMRCGRWPGPRITIVDSAATTAAAVRDHGRRRRWRRRGAGRVRLLATDGAARFARVGSAFLGETLTADAVEIVDLGVDRGA